MISEWRSARIFTILKDGEAPDKASERLSAININVHLSHSPHARPRAICPRAGLYQRGS
jgi:hypothetical protein